MSDFEVVRGYLHDGDGKQYPDGVEALDRIESELSRLREERDITWKLAADWEQRATRLREAIRRVYEDTTRLVDAHDIAQDALRRPNERPR